MCQFGVFYIPLLIYSAPLLASQHWKIHRKQSVGGSCVSICLYSTLIADLKAVYAAADEQAALNALDTFAERWDKKYPKIP